jgi:hypothetical protein
MQFVSTICRLLLDNSNLQREFRRLHGFAVLTSLLLHSASLGQAAADQEESLKLNHVSLTSPPKTPPLQASSPRSTSSFSSETIQAYRVQQTQQSMLLDGVLRTMLVSMFDAHTQHLIRNIGTFSKSIFFFFFFLTTYFLCVDFLFDEQFYVAYCFFIWFHQTFCTGCWS